jgi:molecular chaperone GrpE
MTKKNAHEHAKRGEEQEMQEAQAEQSAQEEQSAQIEQPVQEVQSAQAATPEQEAQSAPQVEEKRVEHVHPTSYEIVEALQEELTKARSKADEYLDGWQRSRAEFTNYKKRVEKEQTQTYQVASGTVVKRFLSVVDDLERALKNRPTNGEGAAWSEGIELIYRKLVNILENEGVTPIQALGQQFDPNFHEAVISEESDEHESGQVIEVLQQGYMLGDRVLRPAMVRVAR